MSNVLSRKSPRPNVRVAGILTVLGTVQALFLIIPNPVTAQASPDDNPTCPDCVIRFDLVMTAGSLDGPGAIPEEPGSVARDSRGRLYLAFPQAGEVGLFDSTGRPLPPVGRRGEGPGEYQWPYLIRVGQSDTVMVLDFNRQLSVVAPSGSFVRRSQVPVSAADFVVIGDGNLVFSESPPATPGDSEATIFHVFNPGQDVADKSFHKVEIKAGGFAPRFYLAPAQEPDRFWTATESGDGYEVMLYASDGILARRFAKSPSWLRPLPAEDDLAPPGAYISGLAVVEDRAWVVGRHPVDEWRRYWNREIFGEGRGEVSAREIEFTKLYRSVVDVVDIGTGELVTSAQVPGLVLGLLPNLYVATYREDDAGVPYVDVFRMSISRRSGGGN